MKLNSIALKLPTAVAALCIVFSGALAYFGYSESHKILLKSANERLVSNMDARARRLENLLKVIEFELIVQSEQNRDELLADARTLRTFFSISTAC